MARQATTQGGAVTQTRAGDKKPHPEEIETTTTTESVGKEATPEVPTEIGGRTTGEGRERDNTRSATDNHRGANPVAAATVDTLTRPKGADALTT